jgi:SAM-dependent methyltransferase
MHSSLLGVLKCPTCGSTTFDSKVVDGTAEDIREGIVWCENRDWFPVEHRTIEFLPPDLQYHADRVAFQQKYAQELRALGLLESPAPNDRSRTPHELNLVQVQQQHFDWYAENDKQAYDSYAAMPFWKIVDRRTFSIWNAGIKAARNAGGGDKLLLDVGCAQGRSARQVAQPGVHVIGFDISKRMARQAYLNFRDVSSRQNWNDFLVADGCHFPFQSGVFDYTLVYGVLHHLPDPAAACREIARMLKDGGTYFGSENNRTGFRAIFDLLQRLAPAWHEEAGAQPLISSRELAQWFSGTGLAIETSSIVFVPPHLVNALGLKVGGFLLAASDAILRAIPVLNGQGGLILIEGTKA